MKITDYTKVSKIVGENVFLLDGPEGTKTITAEDLAKALLGLLSSEEFISGVDMSELDSEETVLQDNNLLIGTEAGNKAVSASALAKALVGMLTSEEMINGLILSELAKTTTLEDSDHLLAGIAAGTRAMTAKDLAKELVKKLTSTELVAGLNLSELSTTDTLTASDYVMTGVSAGNRAMTAKNLGKALVGLLTSKEFISGLKMGELDQISALTATDNILIGTTDGNKYMKAEDSLFAILDAFGPPELHRTTFRGKNLGASVTTEQKAAIQNGTFKGLFLGDYWEIDGVKWRIVDVDYYLNCGGWNDDEDIITKHHLIVMPDQALYTHKMENTGTTANGYAGSLMRSTGLSQAKTTINSAFGSLVMPHEEILVYGCDNGEPEDYDAYTCTVELPSEIMMYGSHKHGVRNYNSMYRYDKQQFALFAVAPTFIIGKGTNGTGRTWCWLRDVVSAACFALVGSYGDPDYYGASGTGGVRPYFLLG